MNNDADFSKPLSDEGSASSTDQGEGLAIQWERARTPVFALLLAKIGSLHDAEDVLQEVAVSVAKDYHKYDQQRPFVAWALGIAKNQALMFLRKQRRDRLSFGEEMMQVIQMHLEHTPVCNMESQREALHECMKSLPSGNRWLLKMRYSGSLALDKIAEEQGKTTASVKGQLYRIRKVLHECIKRRLAAQGLHDKA